MKTILYIMSDVIEPRLNRAQAVKFLLGRPGEAGQTFFHHINRLSAAHNIHIDRLGITSHRYWNSELQSTKQYTDKEYCNMFRELFVRSVEKACGNSDRLGVLLSGGIDSSLVTCVTADWVQKTKIGRLQSFTNLYGNDDERDYANLVVRQKKLEAHFLQTKDIDIFDSINEYTVNTEEPFAHPGYLAIGRAFNVARQKGVKLLLDGSLVDSVISYNPRFIEEYLRKGSIFTGLREAVLFSRRMQGEHSSQLSFFWQRGVLPLFRSVLASELENPQLVLPNFVKDQRTFSEAGRKKDSNYHLSYPMRSFLEATNSANTDVLERRFKLGMANGISFSTPFADKDLVIFCSKLPPEQRVRDGWNRYIVRKSFQDSLPVGIINRGGKFASTSAVKAQLRRALTPERQIEIIETCKVLDHIIEHKTLVGAVRRLTTPDTDVQLRDVISVWSSFSLARWMELFSVAG
jgi:asparagine synthase (glutamine-hydrolysing)